jgi:hypothetical protein
MKLTNVLLSLILLTPVAYAADPCAGSESKSADQAPCPASPDTAGSETLPETAVAKIEKLKVDLRYMRATGHPVEAQKRKDAIAAIYQEHNMPLPEEFSGW